MDYVLQSTILEIAESIVKQNFTIGEDAIKEAEYIVKYYPKELYPNIDEMVKCKPLSNITTILTIRGNKEPITINQIINDFHYRPSVIMALKAISMESNNECGFAWLIDMCNEE